jgi:hypothetical protein
MVEGLINTGKISKKQGDIYYLFAMSDLGRSWLDGMTDLTFMEEPIKPIECGYAFLDGRRSLLRDIKKEIMLINHLLKDEHNGQPEPRPSE